MFKLKIVVLRHLVHYNTIRAVRVFPNGRIWPLMIFGGA